MDGFKPMVKMKAGGSVPCAIKEENKHCSGGKIGKMKEGGKTDTAQDKALIKKAFKQHDEAEHDKEPTEIKLRKGGRSKKAEGTVKKYKAGGAIEMKKDSGDKDTIRKIKATGNKKAEAPSKAAVKPTFKASDVEKEKSKPAGDKDVIKKVKPTGDKKADAPNKAAVKPNRTSINAIDDIQKFSGSDGSYTGTPGMPPEMMDQMRRANQPGGMNANPIVGGQMQQPQQGMQPPFNAYQNFQRQNPNAQPGMTEDQIRQILMSPQFQQSNRNFTDR